jgi:hypothetical protein
VTTALALDSALAARIFLKLDPLFEPLRTERRFQALLRRLRLE